MVNRRKDSLENQFGSTQTALFNVTFKNGKFINVENGEPIKFKEGSFLRIKTGLSSIEDDIYNEITRKETREVLSVNTELHFNIQTNLDNYYFIGRLIAPLLMTKKNNKDSVISNCDYIIEKVHSNSKTEVLDLRFNSLNQAFFQMSLRYRPNNKSHVCNVYNTFKTNKGDYLEIFRF